MPNLNEIKEAVERVQGYLNSDTFCAFTSYWNDGSKLEKESKEVLKVLLTLAQQVLDAKCPEEARPLPGSLSSPDSYIVGKRDGYNQALSDFRLYQAKCLEELEEVITNSSLSKALGDKYIKNHKGAEFGIFVWDKALSDLAQAIRDLLGRKE